MPFELLDQYPGASQWTDEVTVIGPRLFFKGEIRAPGPVVVAGQVDGPVISGELVRVVAGAQVRGAVRGAAAVIEGTVNGAITVSGAVELHPTARVRGDVTGARVLMGEGAQVRGKVRATSGAVERVVPEPPGTSKGSRRRP